MMSNRMFVEGLVHLMTIWGETKISGNITGGMCGWLAYIPLIKPPVVMPLYTANKVTNLQERVWVTRLLPPALWVKGMQRQSGACVGDSYSIWEGRLYPMWPQNGSSMV